MAPISVAENTCVSTNGVKNHKDSETEDERQAVNGISKHEASDQVNTHVTTSPERDGQYIPKYDEHGYSIVEQPMGTKRRMRVVIMGAAVSTVNFLKKAEEEMSNLTVTVYEKNHDVGGTWLENRYPGCACDIPSVNYQFNWKIKLWTHYYSYSPEIWEYLKEIYDENDSVRKYVKL